MKVLSLYSRSAFLVLTTTRTRQLFLFGAKIATQRSISSDIVTTSSKKPTKTEDSTKINTTETVFQVGEQQTPPPLSLPFSLPPK